MSRLRSRSDICRFASGLLLATPAVSAAGGGGSFDLSWTDRLGNTHPLRSTQVTLLDVRNGVETPVGSWLTDESGRLNFLTNYTRPGGATLQLVVDVRSIVGATGTASTEFNGDPFTFRLPGTYALPNNTFSSQYVPPAVDNSNDAGKAIGFMQGLKVAADHFRDLGANVPYASVRFAPRWGNGSYMSGPNMNLGYDTWGAWDVAFHEFAHGVADLNDLDAEPHIGVAHSFNQDNVAAGPSLGPNLGTRLAWQEGIASYLGTSALRNRLTSSFPGMPAADSNTSYDRFASTGTLTPDASAQFNVDLEDRAGAVLGSPFVITGKGEGDELSVARVLWDLEDATPGESFPKPGRQDSVALGVQGVYDLMVQAGRTGGGRLLDAWRSLVDAHGTTALDRSRLGDIFEANAVSAIPGASGGIADGGWSADDTPTLAWAAQNGGNSDRYQVAVYSADWSTLLQVSPELVDATSWEVGVPLPHGTYNWVVISNSVVQSAVNFDYSYWSGGASFAIVPEPAGLFFGAAFAVLAGGRGRRGVGPAGAC